MNREKSEAQSSSDVKQEKFSQVEWDVPVSIVDVIVRKTTTLSITQYYFACIGESFAHF